MSLMCSQVFNLRGVELLGCRVCASLTLLYVLNCSLGWLYQFQLLQQCIKVPIFLQTQIWLLHFCQYDESKMVSPFYSNLHFPESQQGWTYCLYMFIGHLFFPLPWIVWMWNTGDRQHSHKTCHMWKWNWIFYALMVI